MSTTVLFVLACLAVFCAAENITPSDRDYVNCHPVDGDVVLYTGVVNKPYQALQRVTADLAVSTGQAIIHCVQAVNTNPDGHPATVTVTSGGLDYNSINLHFESEWMRGIYYNVTVTGQ